MIPLIFTFSDMCIVTLPLHVAYAKYCFWFTYCKVWIIVQLAEDSDSSNDIRVLGGIPLLLVLLQ